MKTARAHILAIAFGCLVTVTLFAAGAARAQCSPGDIPTGNLCSPVCNTDGGGLIDSTVIVMGAPLMTFMGNPLVVAASWLAARAPAPRAQGAALAPRVEHGYVLRGGRKPRQVAW